MASKNKFKPKETTSATPWKEEAAEEGDGKQKISGPASGIKKSIFNRKAG